MIPQHSDWAYAIAHRIADEMDLDADDRHLLESTLIRCFNVMPNRQLMRLVGTGIIEEDYFEPLDGCPYNDPLHDDKDGCPSCWQAEQENKGVPDEQDLAVKLNDKGDK